MNPTYEQLSARVKELEQGIASISRLAHAVDVSYPNKVEDTRKICGRLLKDDEFLQRTGFVRKGQQYYATGKVGNRISDGMMGREFRTDDDSRCWLYRDLSIKDD